MYDFRFYKKDLMKPLFAVNWLGYARFLKFLEHAETEELEMFSKIEVLPMRGENYYIDIEPKNLTQVFTLGTDSMKNLLSFYEACDKRNIARMSMKEVY